MTILHALMMQRGVVLFIGVLALATALVAGQKPVRPSDAQADAERSSLWSIVQDNCLSCHSSEHKSGDVAFAASQFDAETANVAMLQRVFEKVATGEMPPEDAPTQLSRVELDRFIDGLGQSIAVAQDSVGTPMMRASRLTNEEYAVTISDLLGVNFDPDDPGRLIADGSLHGFKRIREVQAISAAHMERYVAAAESIIEEAYPVKSPATWRWSADAVDLLLGAVAVAQDIEQSARNAGARIDLWPGQSIRTVELEVPAPGDYQFRLRASSVAAGNGRSPWLTITAESLDRLIFAGPWLAEESSPRDLQFTAHLPAGRHVFSISNQVHGPGILAALQKSLDRPFQDFAQGYVPWQVALLADDKSPLYPCVLIDEVQVEGPVLIVEQHRRRSRFLTPRTATVDQAISGLSRFMELAFRRTPTESEREIHRELLGIQVAQGESLFEATKTAMVAVLSSREFLYLNDTPPLAQGPRQQQWALASRLSYLLWNTMPDRELLDLARDGRLADDDVLRQQLRRMLNDPRAECFAKSFPQQWLQLDRIGQFPPDKSLYPNYDLHLETSFQREPVAYFLEMLGHNLPLRDFLTSDWAMLDARLAGHYGISGVTSHEFARVQLESSAHRGGLLTQAGILSLTSDGARQRPIHRGAWVWETILGKSIPAPPANVEPIAMAATNEAKATIRARLESHQKQPACAACHRKIDPLGFAFENYDALGRWRSVEKVRGGAGDDPPVDASGQLVEGRTFADVDEFKKLLVDDVDEFAQAFVRKLAVYGLRRRLTPADVAEIGGIAQAANDSEVRLRDLLEAFVMSDLFRGRSNSTEQSSSVPID